MLEFTQRDVAPGYTSISFDDTDGDEVVVDIHTDNEWMEVGISHSAGCFVLEKDQAIAFAKKILEVFNA